MSRSVLFAAAAAAAFIAAPASAAQIVLSGSSVIGSTGGFDARFTPDNIVDRQTGIVTENFADGSYWLNPEGRQGAFITLDLGAAYRLGRFDLFNSRNIGDRGTAGFEIRAGNTLVAATGTGTGATGQRLGSDARTIAAGTLFMDRESNQPFTAQAYAATDTETAFRYVEFVPLGSINRNYNNLGFGLNELRVFEREATAAVPEPASWAMMIGGFGLVGVAARRRRVAFATA